MRKASSEPVRYDDSQLKRSLRRGVRHLFGVPSNESLEEHLGERSAHLLRRGERALRSIERVMQGLGIAPPPLPRTVTPIPRPIVREQPPQASKFDLGQRPSANALADEHIPWGYGVDRVTAMPVDPDHLYTYWEVTDRAIESARASLGPAGAEAWLNLRVYDVTGRIFDGTNAHAYFDHRVERHDRQWFFTIGKPGSTLCVEIGMKSSEGYFARISRSGRADLPRSAPVEAGEVEWLAVRPATGDPEGSHMAPPPGRSALAGDDAAGPATADGRAGAGENGHDQGPDAAHATRTGRTSFEEWRETLPGWELRRSTQWVGDVERSTWEAGPFAHPVEAPRYEVEHGSPGQGRVEESSGATRIVEGPWQVTIRGVDGYVRRRVLARWEMVRSVPAQAASDADVVYDRVMIGGSEHLVARGASERVAGASEVRLSGASEEFMIGASELRFRGASERLLLGASERRWPGASEQLGGASRGEWSFAGASERAHAGASEHRLGGASERSGARTWQAFAEEGSRLVRAAESPASAPAGASERRLGASENSAAPSSTPGQALETAGKPSPPRW